MGRDAMGGGAQRLTDGSAAQGPLRLQHHHPTADARAQRLLRPELPPDRQRARGGRGGIQGRGVARHTLHVLHALRPGSGFSTGSSW